jgi:hypothetical protein
MERMTSQKIYPKIIVDITKIIFNFAPLKFYAVFFLKKSVTKKYV